VDVPDPSGDEARAQARQLASSADQSVILGDLPRALALLVRATELDPTSPELAYRHARALEGLGQTEAAMAQYCRALGIDPDATGIDDARDRLEALAAGERERVPESAVVAFRVGLARADQGLLEEAAESFGLAAADAPGWADALYNRGVALAEAGRAQAAADDLRRYLELRPDAPDAIAVSQRIGQLEAAATVSLPSPGAALTLGVVFPGMGQFYTGRPVIGAVVLSAAGSAMAAGLFIKNVVVRCLVPVGPDQDCPPGQTVSEEVERPYLLPAVAVGAAVALIGAIEAAVRARGRRGRARAGGETETAMGGGGGRAAGAEAIPRPRDGVRLAGPAVTARGRSLDLRLVGIRFR
jgi:tetratricopeptide (TPR) repeat protein